MCSGRVLLFWQVYFREDQLSEVIRFCDSTRAQKQNSAIAPRDGLVSNKVVEGGQDMVAQAKTRKKARDAGAFKGIMTRMNADGWRALRVLAAEQDTTLNALAVEAFNDLLKKYGKKASVDNPLID